MIGTESEVHWGSTVRNSQAFPGFLTTTHHLCALLKIFVFFSEGLEFVENFLERVESNRTPKKEKQKETKEGEKKDNTKKERSSIRSGASGLPYYCTPLVWVPGVIGALLCGCKTFV